MLRGIDIIDPHAGYGSGICVFGTLNPGAAPINAESSGSLVNIHGDNAIDNFARQQA
jgi:hypothetical protein